MIDLKIISHDYLLDCLGVKENNRQPIKNFDINILENIPFKYVPFVINSNFDESWDTKNLNILPSATFADIYHETAHFVLMDGYHGYYDFGLGAGFASDSTSLNKPKFDQVFCDDQENMACLIEWTFMEYYGHSVNEIAWIMKHETYFDYSLDYYTETHSKIMKNKSKFQKYGINLVG